MASWNPGIDARCVFQSNLLFPDLLPVDDLTVTPGSSSAVVAWNLSDVEKEQNVSTHVMIKVCKSLDRTACLDSVDVLKSEVRERLR